MPENYANPAALVTTEWVAEHGNDPNVRLLEVDVDTSAYGQGHIAGAVGINWTTQLGDPIRDHASTVHGERAELRPARLPEGRAGHAQGR
jgi:3-mercaptopyruvate sulfurtransferase SseA